MRQLARMIHKIALAMLFALLSFTTLPAAATVETSTDETRAGLCEEFSGLAFGFCVALCEARQCDLRPVDDERCAVLRRGFDRATGGVDAPC